MPKITSYYCDGCGTHRCVCNDYPSFDCRDSRKNPVEVTDDDRNKMFDYLRACNWLELDKLMNDVRARPGIS